MNKLIFTDVDGTLYDYDGNLAPSTIEAIKKTRANGNKVILVTGRSKAENRQELWDIGFDGMIGGNGSYIEIDNKVIFHNHLSLVQCTHIVDWCHKNNIEFILETNNGLFFSEHFAEKAITSLRKYAIGKGASTEEASNLTAYDVYHGYIENGNLYRDDVNKVSFPLNSNVDLEKVKNEFKDMKIGCWGGKAQSSLFGDITVNNIDKGKAIEKVLNYLNIDVKDTYAIGDATIDIPMLKYCNIGITFSSGGEDVKQIADYVTDDVANDGFYKAFDHFELI